MQARAWGVVVGVATVVGVAVALIFASSDDGEELAVSRDRNQQVDVASTADAFDQERLTPERARELEAGVNARDPDRLVEVALLGHDDDPVEVAAAVLPPGGVLAIAESSFERLDTDGAAVDGVIDGVDGTWYVQLWLDEQDGLWMLAGSTAPQPVDAEPVG